MLVSPEGVRIDGVLSLFFLKQVSSDLLHVWVLVCCVFNFAVDCIRAVSYTHLTLPTSDLV